MTAAAEETPWLRLARISDDQKENKRLWNGYQKYLLRPNRGEYQRQMEMNEELGRYVPQTLLDLENVDKRRTEIGMEPISAQLERFNEAMKRDFGQGR